MNIRKILKEELELAEDYPVGFNLQEFSELRSFAQRIKYCRERLKPLGTGSSRIAFAVDDDKVLKIAKNAKGVAQNESEAHEYKQNYGIVAKVFEYHPDYLWVEMEIAKKVSSKRFRQVTGVDIEDCLSWIRYNRAKQWKAASSVESRYENDGEVNEFWYDFVNFLADHGYQNLDDYGVLSSYGEVMREGSPSIVLVDFGINDEIYQSHYKR